MRCTYQYVSVLCKCTTRRHPLLFEFLLFGNTIHVWLMHQPQLNLLSIRRIRPFGPRSVLFSLFFFPFSSVYYHCNLTIFIRYSIPLLNNPPRPNLSLFLEIRTRSSLAELSCKSINQPVPAAEAAEPAASSDVLRSFRPRVFFFSSFLFFLQSSFFLLSHCSPRHPPSLPPLFRILVPLDPPDSPD